MKHLTIRIARLKEMIALEEKRVSLQGQISTLDERLAAIQSELYGAGSARATSSKELRAPATKVVVKLQPKGKRKGRGELKGQILEMLQAAGNPGSSVKELAGRIGVKAANIHSWFSSNIKKVKGLQKVGEARYALNGAVVAPSKPAKKAKGAKAKKVKAAKAPKAVKKVKAVKAKAIKPIKKAKAKAAGAGKVKAVRGQLKGQILNELKNAGAEGVTIKDLAAKLNANYKNVYIWFVTTGKRIPEIKKVGPAQYKLEAA